MKKKIIIAAVAIILILVAALFAIFHFTNNKEDLSTKVNEKSSAYLTDLKDSASTFTSNEKIADYLCSWAKSKGVKYSSDTHGNIVFNVKSSTEYKAAAPTVILCTYDSEQIDNCLSSMAVALYTAKNNESTGKLTVIFTPANGNDYSGVKSLNSKYFPDSANVFCLNGGAQAKFSTATGAMSSYTLTNSIEKTEPSGEKAIKITINGLTGGSPDGKISSYPNPIKLLSDLLAYFKNNAYIYELSSFKGGTDNGVYPTSAEMTIVIGTDSTEKFITILDGEVEDFTEENKEDYPDATYSYSEIKLPNKVLTEKSNNSFISLMYTLESGAYYRDEDDNLISIANIGSVIQKDSSIEIKVRANSLTDEGLMDIDTSQSTICSLSNAKYKKTDTMKTWKNQNEQSFNDEVAKAFNEYSGKNMEYSDQIATTNANYVFEKNKKCNIMNVTLYEDKVERYAGTLVTFLINQTHTE